MGVLNPKKVLLKLIQDFKAYEEPDVNTPLSLEEVNLKNQIAGKLHFFFYILCYFDLRTICKEQNMECGAGNGGVKYYRK